MLWKLFFFSKNDKSQLEKKYDELLKKNKKLEKENDKLKKMLLQYKSQNEQDDVNPLVLYDKNDFNSFGYMIN